MRIVNCDKAYADAWDAFLQGSSKASLYHRFAWKEINERLLGHRAFFLAAIDRERIVGVFPFVQVKSRLFGNIACSMPFVNFGGPCSDSPAVEQLLIDEAVRISDELDVEYLEIRSQRHLGGHLPTSEHKVSMTVDLCGDPDVLWKAFKTAHRQDIRRGYKNGLTARFGGAELVASFYDVLSESWRNLGTPIYEERYFEQVVETLPDSVRLCVVFAGSEPAGAALIGSLGDTVEGMWLGHKARYRTQLVGYVLYWELIKDACERGFRRFHLGRSTAGSGSEVYKKKWNAYPTQLYWQYVLRRRQDIPQLNVANPRYRLAIATWQKLPVRVTQVVGPLIARSIP